VVIIQSNRGPNFLVLNGTTIEWTGATAQDAELFEFVPLEGTISKVRAGSTGNFIRLSATDEILADADFDGGARVEALECGAPYVSLYFTDDDDEDRFASTEGDDVVRARNAYCTFGSATSWEKFQLMDPP
jgi:hypothetical protein